MATAKETWTIYYWNGIDDSFGYGLGPQPCETELPKDIARSIYKHRNKKLRQAGVTFASYFMLPSDETP